MLNLDPRGITLVEGLITVVLVALLTSLAPPSAIGWLEQGRVRAAAELIHAGIQLARAEAITRNSRVQFLLNVDTSWAVACTAVTPGCPDTAAIHAFDGVSARGSATLTVNGAGAAGPRSVAFTAQGRPDTGEGSRITSVGVAMATKLEWFAATRELRADISDFGRTRLCCPNAAVESPTRC